VVNIKDGTLSGVGGLCFYGRQHIPEILGSAWNILSIQHKEVCNHSEPRISIHADWEIIAEKS
jgi:hypothetical protein